jgi:hypothetical protein
MSLIQIRRVFTHVETILHEFGPAPATPQIRGSVAAVLTNPYAGQYHADILPMMEALNPVGLEMAGTLLRAMNMQPEEINSYGKGSIVGSAGELEHGALWHVPGGYAMRELLGWHGDRAGYTQGAGNSQKPAQATTTNNSASNTEANAAPRSRPLAIVPSTKKVGSPGTRLDVPLTHITASYVRSHFDAMEVAVPGAPAADELVFILVMSTGARIHARVGGLTPEGISQFDGQR